MPLNPLLREVFNTITFHNLLRPGEAVVVDCRGDAAGVALLYALAGLESDYGFPLRLTAVHMLDPFAEGECDGEEGARAAEEAARGLGVRFCPLRLPADGSGAERWGARAAVLVRTAEEEGATAVAFADCADDRAEEVLAAILSGRIARTTLAGSPVREPFDAQRGIFAVRPFHRLRREMFESFLRAKGFDPSLLPPPPVRSDFHRRLRHELLPLLESRYNPRIREALLRLADSAAGPPPET